MMTADPRPVRYDYIRQGLNLIFAPAMWVFSTLPQITEWGRSASEFSDQNDSLLVPFGVAFSIWLPIFILCTGYSVQQAWPRNRTRDMFRDSGGWTAAGFAGVIIWALISAHAPPPFDLYGTAIVFLVIVVCLIRAMLILGSYRAHMTVITYIFSLMPISLIAGWTSLAMFLNWTPIVTGKLPLSDTTTAVLMLGVALSFAIFILRKCKGNPAYAFPVIWGLGFLAVERYSTEIAADTIGVLAFVGATVILIITTLYSLERTAKTA